MVVDGDAIAGTGSNADLVEDVVRDGTADVDVCDGAESIEHIQQLVAAGAAHVVVGSRALEESSWIANAADLYPGLLIVATSVRERRVVTRGWVRTLPLDVLDVVNDLSGLALGGFLVEVPDEPARRGTDLSLIEDVVEACPFPLIVKCHVQEMNDLRALEHRGVSAVLLGESLYGGALDTRAVAMEFGE